MRGQGLSGWGCATASGTASACLIPAALLLPPAGTGLSLLRGLLVRLKSGGRYELHEVAGLQPDGRLAFQASHASGRW